MTSERAIEILEMQSNIPSEDYSLEEIFDAHRFAIKCIKAYVNPKLKQGMKVWYYDKDDSDTPEEGIVAYIRYEDDHCEVFGVDFNYDFDEFYASAIGDSIFLSEIELNEYIENHKTQI